MGANWHRIERRDRRGHVRDWVEVGRCGNCGRGVDRDFPAEYREVGDELYCRLCFEGAEPAAHGVAAPATNQTSKYG